MGERRLIDEVLEAIRQREAEDIAAGRVVVFCGCAFPAGSIPSHLDEVLLFSRDVLHRIVRMPTSAEIAAYIQAGYTDRGTIVQMAARAVADAFQVNHVVLLRSYIRHYQLPLWELEPVPTGKVG